MIENEWTDSEARRMLVVVFAGGTVVANLKTDLRLIEWAKKSDCFVRIDRKSDWGNPYKIGEDGDREEVISKFQAMVVEKLATIEAESNAAALDAFIQPLVGKVLGCHCHPEGCHGTTLAGLANLDRQLGMANDFLEDGLTRDQLRRIVPDLVERLESVGVELGV